MATTAYFWPFLFGSFPVNDLLTTGVQASPAVAGLTNGRYFCLWDEPGGSLAVDGRVFQGNGAPLASQFLVNSTTSNDQFDASIAALPNGNAVVAFTDTSLDP